MALFNFLKNQAKNISCKKNRTLNSTHKHYGHETITKPTSRFVPNFLGETRTESKHAKLGQLKSYLSPFQRLHKTVYEYVDSTAHRTPLLSVAAEEHTRNPPFGLVLVLAHI